MTSPADPTTLGWPYWMLRYVGSDHPDALDDLVWSVGGSPPYGGVSYEEAAAVYELLEDYQGPGEAGAGSYERVESFLEPGSAAWLALQVFRCADQVQSDAEDYDLDPATRGLDLARRAGHRGAAATFLSFEAGWYLRNGDMSAARARTLDALETFLELADEDEAYAERVRQSAVNAVSLTAMSGDIEGAQTLLAGLIEVIDPATAEQLRRSLAAAR